MTLLSGTNITVYTIQVILILQRKHCGMSSAVTSHLTESITSLCSTGVKFGRYHIRLNYKTTLQAYHAGRPLCWRNRGGEGSWEVQSSSPPRNSEVLTKLSRIPSSVENTSVTTLSEHGFHWFANWVEPLTGGLPPPDPRSLCPLSSIEFVEPPAEISWVRHWLFIDLSLN
jgi:hypothetical protein